VEVGLLSHLTLLDNALSNLGHVLELARVTPPLADQAEVEELAQEKQLKSLREELQEFYNELGAETFQQLRAVAGISYVEKGQVSHQPGEISGYAYRADARKPLADVVVTLESPAAPQGDKFQRTAVDGSYEFAGLAPGIYWVIAYRNGFVGSVYGVGASQDASKGLISVVSGQKRQGINFTLSPVPNITKLSGKAPTGVTPEGNVAGGAGIMHSVEGNSLFTVTAWYGQLAMSNPDGEDPYIVATGGNELYTFVFDPARSIVFYPVAGRYNGAIVSFNLTTKRYQTTPLPFSEALKLLGVKQDQQGALASYTVDGPCVPKALANGENPWILPNHSSPVSQSISICLARIPNPGSD
jgi:hypothetical protein